MMRSDTHAAGMIDAYVADLADALRGPRRAKADLIAEARDSLVDATEAYARRGFDRAAAERRAVQEFGMIAEIAVGYQTELGLAQGPRSCWLPCCGSQCLHTAASALPSRLGLSRLQHGLDHGGEITPRGALAGQVAPARCGPAMPP